ncbi:MAG: GtrA family protein [Bacteroidota bacterium]
MDRKLKTLILYTLFALIATSVNLITQWPFFLFLSSQWSIYIALIFGTFSGLLTKYVLDKKWIFYYTPTDRSDDLYRFILYSIMGVFTTIIFWGTEISFYYLFDFKGSQYIGGGLGLMVGYFIKYILDKRYVFEVSV